MHTHRWTLVGSWHRDGTYYAKQCACGTRQVITAAEYFDLLERYVR